MVDSSERFRLPLPNEHGAVVMTAAALLTPLAVVVSSGGPGLLQLAPYAAFVALIAGALLLREAIKRRRRTNDAIVRRRLTAVAAGETVAIVALSGVLVLLSGPAWILGVVLVPLVVVDLRLRNHGWPIPMGGELSGVFGISLLVPAAATLLEVGDPFLIGGLWLVFLAFHVGSVLRVAMSLPGRSAVSTRGLLTVGLAYHGVFIVLAALAWLEGWAGLATPLVFAAAVVRVGQLVARGDGPVELRALGRAEGTLSVLFVLAAPWLVS